MQNKNNVQNLKKKPTLVNEKEYRSNANYLTSVDMDMEMEEFFKELDFTDEFANKKFSPNVFEVKKIFVSDSIYGQKAESDLKSNKSKKSDDNEDHAEKANKRKSIEEKNFIANLLGGKKASLFQAGNSALAGMLLQSLNKYPTSNSLIDPPNNSNEAKNENLKLNKNKKIDPIKLTVSDDPKLKPYDMMYLNAVSYADLEVQKKKIFAMTKSFKQSVELGDMIYRLGRKFMDFAMEETANLNALECWEAALKIYIRLQSENLRVAEVYKHSSVLYLKENSNPETALKVISLALDMFKSHIGEFSYDYAESLTNQGYILEYLERPNDAKINFDKSLEIYKQIFKNIAVENNEESLNNEITLKNDYIEFKTTKSHIQKEIGDCYFRLGHTYESLAQENESISSYKIAYTVYENFYGHKNNKFCGSCLYNISYVFLKQKNYEDAIQYFFQTLEIYSDIEEEFNDANGTNIKSSDSLDVLIKIAKLYMETNKYDQCVNMLEIVISEILICIDTQDDTNPISNILEMNLIEYGNSLSSKMMNKEKEQENQKNENFKKEEETKNLLVQKFLENYENLEGFVMDYNLTLFEVVECLCEVYVTNENIVDLILSTKIFIIFSPPLENLINKSYEFIILILKNFDDNIIHEEILRKIETVLDEFSKFFEIDYEEELITENNISNFNNNHINNNQNNNSNIQTELTSNKRGQTEGLINVIDKAIKNTSQNNIQNIPTNSNQKSDERICEMLNNIGIECSRIGLIRCAIEYFSKTISYYKKNPNNINLYVLSDLFNNLAIELDNAGDQENCYTNFIQSLKIKMDIYGANHLKTAGAHQNIGIVLERQGKYKQALDHWSVCMEIKKKNLGDENHIQLIIPYYNIGYIYLKIGEMQKALSEFIKVYEIYKKNPDIEDITFFNNTYELGEVYYLLKDYKNTINYLDYLNSKITLCQEKLIKNNEDIKKEEMHEDPIFHELEEIKYKCKILLGISLSFEKKYKEAVEQLKYALNNVPLEMEDALKYFEYALSEMAKSCEAINDLESALEYYKQTIEFVKGKWSQDDLLALQKKKDNIVNINFFLYNYIYLIFIFL